ncbi:MAG: HAD family phosphatase [Clostridia bacterium]|nr:HAD family phosphatase [Clostridia bacterium]
MIKNYIFDFGNVLARFYADELTAPCVSDTAAQRAISEVVFDRIYWDKLDNGSITDDEVRAGICSRLPAELHKKACAVYDRWVENLTPVAGMQQLIADISKTDKKLYLLSNISIGFADTYAQVPWINELLSHFDGLVLSGTIGMVKPDGEIFEHLLSKFSLKAGESLFIDDSPKNIAGAEAAGLQGYLFDGDADRLRKFLDI